MNQAMGLMDGSPADAHLLVWTCAPRLPRLIDLRPRMSAVGVQASARGRVPRRIQAAKDISESQPNARGGTCRI